MQLYQEALAKHGRKLSESDRKKITDKSLKEVQAIEKEILKLVKNCQDETHKEAVMILVLLVFSFFAVVGALYLTER